jgi:hypothetical protein
MIAKAMSACAKKPIERALRAGSIALLAALLLGVSVASAQEPFEADLAVVPDQVVIGDVVRVTASVTHPAGYVVGPLVLESHWGPFEVRALEAPVISTDPDGTETTSVTFEGQVFKTGELTTPSLTLTVISPTGAETVSTAAPVPVDVTSILQDGELRDIRAQAEYPDTNIGLIVGAVLAGLAAVAIAVAALVYVLRGRTARVPAPTLDLRSPYEKAIAELARIHDLGLAQDRRFKQHYVETSDVLRSYIDGEFGLDAVESTTAEVSRQIRASSLEWILGHRVLTILYVSDLVKFARYSPSPDEADALIPDAAALVDDLHREAVNEAAIGADKDADHAPVGWGAQ